MAEETLVKPVVQPPVVKPPVVTPLAVPVKSQKKVSSLAEKEAALKKK